LFALTAIMGVIWFVTGWKYGHVYQGRYIYVLCVLNVLWLLCLWLIRIDGSRRASFATNLAFHGMLFAGLAWCAFPWLGEMP
jgi:hypothetical protein